MINENNTMKKLNLILIYNKDNIKCDIGNNLIINDSLGAVFSNIRIL